MNCALFSIVSCLLLGLACAQVPFTFSNNSPFTSLIKRQFTEFTTWVDCKERLPVLFYYYADYDVGDYPRSSTFKLDPTVSSSCQQLTANSYGGGTQYDRGHMVTANHLDHNLVAITESNYMTNIAPQTGVLNKGAWLWVEEMIECVRDIHPLKVYGGIVMGNDASNDIWLTTHGVRTPDWFWKVI